MKIVLDRWAYGKNLFLSLCDAHGVKPNGWGPLDDLLKRQYFLGFKSVWWNHSSRKFWVQPKYSTWRTLVDPCDLFSDRNECEDCSLDGRGWVLDDAFSDDGAPLTMFGAFYKPGSTYDLMESQKSYI